MDNITVERYLRGMVADLVREHQPPNLIPLEQFCREKKISRSTVWRAEKRGELQLTRIGTRVFVNLQQFTTK
jgi:hypothetical protein